jgi:RNA polymerase sigma-70 factor (ECF subfamily)
MIAAFDIASGQPASASTDRAERSMLLRTEALHDAGLVRRFNAGEANAFVEIVDRYRARMFAVAFAVLKNRADAEEIAQDTFIRAHRGLAKFRGDGTLAAWLHCIALNLSRNRYWYFHRRRRHLTLSLDGAFSDDNAATFADLVATEAAGPAREAVAREFSALVAECMQRLDQRPREILTLRNSLNLSYREIAKKLGISVGTVKSRITRARVSLRVLLSAACPEFGRDAQPVAWFDPVRPACGVEVICA